jgi:hypothetical protein
MRMWHFEKVMQDWWQQGPGGATDAQCHAFFAGTDGGWLPGGDRFTHCHFCGVKMRRWQGFEGRLLPRVKGERKVYACKPCVYRLRVPAKDLPN